jgi:hypothetical protein
MTTPSTSNPRSKARSKRGAQPGNLNALKHGFYSHAFSRSENQALQQDLLGDLAAEEHLLRVLIARVMESMQNRESTHAERIDALRTVSLAIGRIESIVRHRELVFDDETVLEKILKKAKFTTPEESV